MRGKCASPGCFVVDDEELSSEECSFFTKPVHHALQCPLRRCEYAPQVLSACGKSKSTSGKNSKISAQPGEQDTNRTSKSNQKKSKSRQEITAGRYGGVTARIGHDRSDENAGLDSRISKRRKTSLSDHDKTNAATIQAEAGTILRHFDRDKEVHVMLLANEWALSSTLIREHEGKLHPVRFCGRVLKDAEMNYHPAEKEVLALLLLLKVCYTQLAGRTIHVYTRFSTLAWVLKSKTLFGRKNQFAVMLSPWHLVVQWVKERDCSFAQLLQVGLASFVDLDGSLAQVAPPTNGSPSIRMDPNLLYARLPRSYLGFVLSFDGSAKPEKHVTAASAYLETTMVNLAEYAGMNNGVQAALDHTTEDLVIVGDSRLAIQQSLGVIACRKESLLTQLNRHRERTAKLRPFRVKRKVEEFAYELELPNRSGYRFYPVVHVSRLKAVNEFGSRRTPEVAEETRLDFGEELLPEDSWEPGQLAGKYEVEAILDDLVPLSTGTKRAVREFNVKWLGYDKPTWEPASSLSCGGLLYDYLREKRSDRRVKIVQVADEG
ncbi:Hypothetical protein PHPALM_16941 [Phytophthora palmivora]|uniref:Chromo domain-containing protein n=1 Tax=Phytophthora palmivora TaxID=4796 RepID=A0A2P4XNH7_9STRA|nr:Hypothetical protein PHPALM_16941 [Phytophthora palmivora]